MWQIHTFEKRCFNIKYKSCTHFAQGVSVVLEVLHSTKNCFWDASERFIFNFVRGKYWNTLAFKGIHMEGYCKLYKISCVINADFFTIQRFMLHVLQKSPLGDLRNIIQFYVDPESINHLRERPVIKNIAQMTFSRRRKNSKFYVIYTSCSFTLYPLISHKYYNFYIVCIRLFNFWHILQI